MCGLEGFENIFQAWMAENSKFQILKFQNKRESFPVSWLMAGARVFAFWGAGREFTKKPRD